MLHIQRPAKWTVRSALQYGATATVAGALVLLFEENGRKFLEDRHWNEFLTRWAAAMPDLSEIIDTHWFWFLFGLSIGLAGALWVVRIFPESSGPDGTPQIVSDSPPLNREPYDQTVRSALEHIAASPSFAGKIDTAPDELRQAARSGTVTIYGRPESNHMTADNFYKPIEPIKPEHWRDFGFSATKCLFHEDTRQCRTEPDDNRSARYGEAYVDLRVNSAEIKARWPEAPASIDRIPITAFRELGAALGWDFASGGSHHLMDLQEAVRQGGLDGVLTVWGRLNRYPRSEVLMKQEPLDKIPMEHWREFKVHLFPMLDGNNLDTKTWRPKNGETEVGYVDLHLDRSQASAWLKREAVPFKGKTK
jgi:hypothetical protein